jgi:hypothetical protein
MRYRVVSDGEKYYVQSSKQDKWMNTVTWEFLFMTDTEDVSWRMKFNTLEEALQLIKIRKQGDSMFVVWEEID